MTTNQFLDVTELDFNEIKKNLKTYLKNQDRFTDYDFEGSNISILLDLLSYNTHNIAFYLNMVGSEMFIDSAQTREALNSHAKSLNYIPHSRSSAYANVDIQIGVTDNPEFVTIPKNYKFTSTVDGTKLNYIVPQDIIVRKNTDGNYIASDVTLYEGDIVTEYFLVDSEINTETGITTYNNRFKIESDNIDIKSIEVQIQNSSGDTTTREFKLSDSLFGVTKDSKVFFIQANGKYNYELVFGNNIIGKGLDNGNIIKVTYRDTVGEEGNGATAFTKTSDIDGYSSITATTNESARYGSEREDKESIRFNAPRHFQTQERAVVDSDYETLIKTNFPEVQSVIAYGGERIKKYGKVIISVRPHGLSGALSSSLKNRIENFLNGKNITSEPIVIEPDYIHIKVNSTVYYDNNKTTLTSNQIQSAVISKIDEYNDSKLSDFGADIRFSSLVASIDSTDTSITSNETNLRMIKRLYPDVNASVIQSIEFSNALFNHGTKYSSGHESTISSSVFTYTKDQVDYDAYLSDDGLGNIYVYTLNTEGNQSILENNIGTVDYSSGYVTFSMNVKGYNGKIDLLARPAASDIVVNDNKFLVLDPNDYNITIETTNY